MLSMSTIQSKLVKSLDCNDLMDKIVGIKARETPIPQCLHCLNCLCEQIKGVVIKGDFFFLGSFSAPAPHTNFNFQTSKHVLHFSVSTKYSLFAYRLYT